MNRLTQLIYVSSAARLLTEDELVELLEVSRNANGIHHISGLLLYKNGNFMQVIEGDRDEIEQLMKNIESDERHRGIIVLTKDDIEQREFSEWTMGFQNISDESMEGFSRILKGDAADEEDKISPGNAKAVLIGFKASSS